MQKNYLCLIKFFDKRSQDLEEAFHDAGQFYWGIPLHLKNNQKF